ncbi:unnamed protein product [Miscanthus lutarioriparius]|uniref:Reticulon domain-containing protein n=1 Tax=Miscanthus lutarioriparius TaxID=422564 RepID=A0A811PWK3_9POAL|nr:unnamed protein product [Miscanthus lutarioriparius]
MGSPYLLLVEHGNQREPQPHASVARLRWEACMAMSSTRTRVPMDPLEWQTSQEMANSIVASLANTIGAAESVLRVAATGHDKKLFFKVVFTLYFLAALGRVVSGAAVAYAGNNTAN